jgi:hypothetical protein
MVEEDAGAGEKVVGFAVVNGEVVGVRFGAGVGRAGVERSHLVLRHGLDLAKHLRGGRLIVADFLAYARLDDGLEDALGTETGDVSSVGGDVEADADMALGGEVVDLVWLELVEKLYEGDGIGEVAVVQKEPRALVAFVVALVAVEVVDAGVGDGAGAAYDAVDLVTFGEEEFSEVGAVLPGDACDERAFHAICE